MSKDNFKTRLKIAKNKSKNKLERENHDTKGSNLGQAFKMSTELVSAVVVGFILDQWFGTKPWLIIVFFFVGVVAGIMNVIRTAKKIQK